MISMFIPGFPLDSYFDLSFSYDRGNFIGNVNVVLPFSCHRHTLLPTDLHVAVLHSNSYDKPSFPMRKLHRYCDVYNTLFISSLHRARMES